jgi:hypothetical protein
VFLYLSEELLSLFGGNVYVQLFSLLTETQYIESEIQRVQAIVSLSEVFTKHVFLSVSDPAGSRIINGPEKGGKPSHPIGTVRGAKLNIWLNSLL